jgi:hypothetical protein
MGRKSTFSQLPEEIADYFHALLSNGKYTQQQIAEYLNAQLAELGEQPVITRDIVQKQAKSYSERLAVTGERLRRERELAEQMVKEVGCKPSVEQSQVLASLLQSMTTRLGMDMDDREEIPSAKELKELAQAHKILTDSNKTLEQQVKQAKAEMLAEITEKVEKTIKALGISEEKRDIIRAQVLGMG